MPITRHHSGRWLYQFNRVIAGRRYRVNRLLPKGWTRAEAQAHEQRETARLYALAAGVRQHRHLIESAVLLYLQEHAPRLKNEVDIIGALALLQPWYAGKPLDALPDVARAYAVEARAEDGKSPLSPGTIRNRLAYLRAACRWAWKRHQMGEHDPAERMVLPPVKNARQVYLTRADMLRIARAMGLSWSRDMVRIAFYTGMRAGEVLASSVQGDSLAIADSKNGLPRLVPVHPKIAHLARGAWPPAVTVWTASKAFKAAARGVGLGHARLHDLRHSAASEMVNAGVDLYTVGGVLGHKSAVSTARYAHLAQSKLREAIGKIGGGKKLQPAPQAKAA
jgi:integrase